MALRIDLKPKTTEYEFIALSLLPANHCLRTGTTVPFLAVTVSGVAGPGSFEWHNDGAANSIQAGPSALEIVELEPR